MSSTTTSGTVGAALSDSVVVRVKDVSGHAVAGVAVSFVISLGGGSASPSTATSGSNGQASTKWTLGPTAGPNQITVQASGVASTATFTATGVAGAAAGVTIIPHTLRLAVGTDVGQLTGAPTDQFGNVVSGTATYSVHDSTLLSVDATGNVHVLRRDGTTYVYAKSGTATDSAYVVVPATGDSPCFGFPTTATPAVGAVLTTGFGADGSICVHGAAGSEFAVVPYFNSPTPSAGIQLTIAGFGIGTPGALGAFTRSALPVAIATSEEGAPAGNALFHQRMLSQEAAELPARAADARAWYQERVRSLAGAPTVSADIRSGGATATSSTGIPASTVPVVGDLWSLNVNAVDYCSNPTFRAGRVVAVGNSAIIVADTLNPAGGFATRDYQDFAAMVDTLIYPLDTTNFGGPSDIDHNHRIVVFFTSAVNALSASVTGGEILGFYYSRDLFPLSGGLGNCPGSNVGEMFYLMVPDPNGLVSNQQITAAYVSQNTPATIAHEFQHLINASRRLYVNNASAVTEELWLNEGLSHIAEELMFYRSSGLHPLDSIGTQIGTLPTSTWFFADQYNNMSRFASYLAAPETQAPIGSTSTDADLPTRGSIWAFLRYAADRVAPTNESAFWFNLVNSQTTGVQNLDHVTGVDVHGLMHDWALSVFLDDLVPTLAQYQQPSWNFRAAWPTAEGGAYAPHTHSLQDAQSLPIALNAGGVSFVRFAVGAGQDAMILTGQSSGVALPSTLQLTLVRTK